MSLQLRRAFKFLPRLVLPVFVLLACAGARGQRQQQSQQAPTDTQSSILFSVTGKDGSVVNTLRKEDVRVLEDGTPLVVGELAPRADAPLLLAVLIDTSLSLERVIDKAKRAADAFVASSMRPGVDGAAVLTFTNESTLLQAMTTDVEKIRGGIRRVRVVIPPGYVGQGIVVAVPAGTPPPKGKLMPHSTALWDVLFDVGNDVFTKTRGEGRRAVIVITDGVDTGSERKVDDVIKSLIRAGVIVYAVGVGDGRFDGVDEGALRKIAERTGGRAFFPKKDEDFSAAYARIREELLSRYVVTFTPSAKTRADAFRKIRIEITNPDLRRQDLRVAHPHGYFAAAADTPTSHKPR